MSEILTEEVESIVRQLIEIDGQLEIKTISRAWKMATQRILERLELSTVHRQSCEKIFEKILTAWMCIWIPAHSDDEAEYTFTGQRSLAMVALCQLQRDIVQDILAAMPNLPYKVGKEQDWALDQLAKIAKNIMDDWRQISRAHQSGLIGLKGKYFSHVAYRLRWLLHVALGSNTFREFYEQHYKVINVLDQFAQLLQVEVTEKTN